MAEAVLRRSGLWPLGANAPWRLFQAAGAALAVSLAWRVPGALDLALALGGFLVMVEVALLARRWRGEG
jgi:hypothetical protein